MWASSGLLERSNLLDTSISVRVYQNTLFYIIWHSVFIIWVMQSVYVYTILERQKKYKISI